MNTLASLLLATILITIMGPGSASAASSPSSDINFTTPSKNIDCLLYTYENEVVADCLVEQAAWKSKPPVPSDCDLDWVPTEVYLSSKQVGTKFVNTVGVGACRGDIGPLCVANGCTVLAYGKTVKRGRITCASATSGVTCFTTSGTRRGFTVNRAAYKFVS